MNNNQSIINVLKKQLKDFGQEIQFAHNTDAPPYFTTKALVTFSRQKYQNGEFKICISDMYRFITLEKTKVLEFIYWNGGVYQITSVDNSVKGIYKNICEYVREYTHTYRLEIIGESGDLKIGDTRQLSLKLYRDEDEVIDLSSYHFTWSTIDENIATVNQDGLVTGIGKGSTNILVTMEEDNNVNANYTITVKEGVILTLLGDHKITDRYATYEYYISDGRTNVTYELTYSEGDINDYFLVNNSEGAFSIHPHTDTLEGTIYVKVKDSNTGKELLTDQIKVDTNTYTFTLSLKTDDLILGNTRQCTPLLRKNDEIVDSSTYTVEYSSSDNNVATIDNNGLVTSVAVGTVVIKAIVNQYGLSDTKEFKVIEKPQGNSFKITNTKTDYSMWDLFQIETKLIVDGKTITNANITYSSNDEKLATVNKTGEVECSYHSGEVTITATATDYSLSDTFTFTIG